MKNRYSNSTFVCLLMLGPAAAHAAVYSWSAYRSTVLGEAWQPGDAVTIDGDIVYYYDEVDPTAPVDANIGALTIQGGGSFFCNHPDRYSEADDVRQLQVESILVTGTGSTFGCGSDPGAIPAGQEFNGSFTVNFRESEDCRVSASAALNPMCQGLHVMDDGNLYLFGNKGHNTWTHIVENNIPIADAFADNRIVVANADGWNVGDDITIAASELDADVFNPAAAQHFKITNKTANVLTLDADLTRKVLGDTYLYDNANNLLAYNYGEKSGGVFVAGSLGQRYQVKLAGKTDQDGNSLFERITAKHGAPITTLDERTEIANTSRNIRFIGDQTLAIKNAKLGLHMMFMGSPGDIHVDGIEIINGGRHGQLGRYPFHWHWAFDAAGDFIRNASIHDNFNRCITVHRTQNVVVEKNVCVNTIGHAYFLEDGDETGNFFIDNISILTTPPAAGSELLASDNIFKSSTGRITGPAAYWISNPDNIFIGNAAAASGSGYWFSFKDATHSVAGTRAAMDTAFSVFSGNSSHHTIDGVILDGPPNGPCANNPRNACSNAGQDETNRSGDHQISPLNPESNRYAPAGSVGMIVMDDVRSYKSTEFALWIAGNRLIDATHMILADSRVEAGLVFSQYLSNSLLVGSSPALSTTEYSVLTANGQQIAGILLYDGPSRFAKLHFADFDDITRPKVPFRLFGAASQRSQQFASDISFSNNNASMLDFAHDISFKPKRRENWSTGLYVTDKSFGDYSFPDYSIRPDEATAFDAISTFFSTNAMANDCLNAAEWLANTGRKITNASVCPGYFGAWHFNGTLDATFKRITYNADYPDVLFDHVNSVFGWGPVGNFSFPNALIKANNSGKNPQETDDLTYEIAFKNPADYASNRLYDVAPYLLRENDWSPWLVFVPQPLQSCVSIVSANTNLLVDQPDTSDRKLRIRSRMTVADTARDADARYGLFLYADYDYAVPILCGPDTNEDGVLDSDSEDDDGDGVPDISDAFPLDPAEWLDTDSDGIGNNADWDDDNDNVPDSVDAAPLNAADRSEIILSLDAVYKGMLLRQNTRGNK
jgi:hypothetical protein